MIPHITRGGDTRGVIAYLVGKLSAVLEELAIDRPLMITARRSEGLDVPVQRRFADARPHAEIARRAGGRAQAGGSDGLVAVGGGSALDRQRSGRTPVAPAGGRISSTPDAMDAERPDIATRDDCERLVRAFYGRAFTDPVIGWLFTDVARLDLEAHLPRIASFWETVLLGARSYSGGAFRPHAALHASAPLRAGHFARWLWLWEATVDELFRGARAELAKAHARRVAQAFHGRLETMDTAASDPSPSGLTVVEARSGG